MKKLLMAALAATMLFANIYAQDEWADDDWGDGSSAEAGDSSSSGEKTFWQRFSLGIDADLAARFYFDSSTISGAPVKAIPQFKLDLNYDGDSTSFSGTVNLNEDVIRFHPIDVLDEFSANLFVGDFVISAGKMRVVWGKGDKVHVLDNFNANNYTNFIVPDYLDRRSADYMFRVQYNAPIGIRVEGIYTPIMTAERYASTGCWVPKKVSTMTQMAAAVLAAQLGGAGDVTGAKVVQAGTFSEDDLYPDVNKLEYGQFGFYVNFPAGPVDIGVSYYNGHYKQVNADLSGYLASYLASGTPPTGSTVMPTLNYDKLQTFGIDAQSAIGPFTVRAEFAYNLTKDTDGTNPWVHNNSIAYLAGFDVGLPIHNLNLNIQEYGTVVLKNGKASDADAPYYAALKRHVDVDTDNSGHYTNNKLVVQLKDTFYYEKVEAVVKAIYGFERKDLIVMPELSYKVRDGWKATLSGMIIHCFGENAESEFDGWLDNSFIQAAVHYSF